MDCNWRDKPEPNRYWKTTWMDKEEVDKIITGAKADTVIIDDPISKPTWEQYKEMLDRSRADDSAISMEMAMFGNKWKPEENEPEYGRTREQVISGLDAVEGAIEDNDQSLAQRLLDSLRQPYPYRRHFGGNHPTGSLSFSWKAEIAEEVKDSLNQLSEHLNKKDMDIPKLENAIYCIGSDSLIRAAAKEARKKGCAFNGYIPEDQEVNRVIISKNGMVALYPETKIAIIDSNTPKFELPKQWDEFIIELDNSIKKDLPVESLAGRPVEYKKNVFKVGCQEIGYSRLPAILDPIKSYNDDHDDHPVTHLLLRGEFGTTSVSIDDLEKINKHFNK